MAIASIGDFTRFLFLFSFTRFLFFLLEFLVFKEISPGKEELKFLLQERQRKYLNISVLHASRGSTGQCFETFPGFMYNLVWV